MADTRIEPYKNVTDLRQYDRKWRVTNDGTDGSERSEEIWELCIKGKYGQIYPSGLDGNLSISVTSGKMLAKVCAMLGVETPEHSVGDEHVLRFKHDSAMVNSLASLIRAYKSRKGRGPNLTPEQRAKGLAALAAARERMKAKRLVKTPDSLAAA